MTNIRLFLLLVISLALLSCGNDVKNKSRVLKNKSFSDIVVFDDWYFAKQNNKCIIFSFPFSSNGKYLNRDTNYIAINYNPSNDSNELVIISGLQYKLNSKVRIHTNNKDFYLSTQGDKAWFFGNEDNLLQNLVLNQNDIIMFSEFEDGTNSIDKYSTKGLLNAFSQLNSSCISSSFS
jgi:hypothetical protein